MTENLNTGGSLRQIILPYPDFQLGEIIDPYEHNANNSEMIIKINQMVTVLNSFINGEANTSLSAMAIDMPGVEPIEGTDLETFIRTLVNAIRSTVPSNGGSHFVKSAKIEGLPGENVYEQMAFLSEMVTGLDSETGEPIDDGNGQGTTIAGKLEKLLTDFALHKSGTDHDGRYYTKSQIDAMLGALENRLGGRIESLGSSVFNAVGVKLNVDGNFYGTWKGMTLERILSATGTGFGMIEVLNEDPVNPEVGRIWITTEQFVENPIDLEEEEPTETEDD